MTAKTLTLNVNGAEHQIQARPQAPLLYILRNDLQLNSPKYGCGLGECGSCTVLVDGAPARSCLIPVVGMVGRRIVTLEGLGSKDAPDPLQQAFIEHQAAQCGYCVAGIVMTARALLDRNPSPTDDEIRRELAFNLCRCGTHVEILRAVRAAVNGSGSATPPTEPEAGPARAPTTVPSAASVAAPAIASTAPPPSTT